MEKWKSGLQGNQFCCGFFACILFSFCLSYSWMLLFNQNFNQSYIQSVSKLFQFSNSSFLPKDWIKPIIQKPGIDTAVKNANETGGGKTVENNSQVDSCSGKYIYVHSLPRKFNVELLEQCQYQIEGADLCKYASNGGFGVRFDEGWFNTFQYALELIFHSRMKHYKCLTKNSSLASAVYVPFYPGLEFVRHQLGFNTSVRDATPRSLAKWLANTPEWKVLGGRDHFMAFGMISWDFRRYTMNDSDWGNNLFLIPEVQNMTRLGIESYHWDNNEFAVPYPTYFHPSSDEEVFRWQRKMRRQEKKYLFSFAGAPRPYTAGSIRSQIIEQCGSSKKCKLLDCDKSNLKKCFSPTKIMKLFQNSVFCLQPAGDTPTRRSSFDAILHGCIPVFFHPGSAYAQYIFHLPQNYTKYSVYIPEDDIRNGKASIETILSQISNEDVKAMRNEVINLIPKLIYANRTTGMEAVEDAFDISIKKVIKKVDEARKEIQEGRVFYVNSMIENSWKYKLWGKVKEHEWDNLFGISAPKDVNAQ